MRTLISPQAMRAGEAQYFETSNVPSIDVMERAAAAVCYQLVHRWGHDKTAYFACGTGGNGGDGYACARLYARAGGKCVIFAAAPAKSADAIENCRRAQDAGIEVHPAETVYSFPKPDVWVDALFGTGFSRSPDNASADLIRRMNMDRGKGAATVAVDIPSGLNGETGAASDPCVHADVTVTFHRPKTGHFLQDGLDVCGEVITADVGFPEDMIPDISCCLFEPEDIRFLFLPAKRNQHKGSCGHLLIIAGSFGMAGAAALCAKAALRSGVGLVSIACPKSIVPMLQTLAPCAMCIPLAEQDGAISEDALPALLQALQGKSAVAIGPGLTRKVPPTILEAVLWSELPAVIDADALNIISENPEVKNLLKPHHVITPHPGEAARLLGHRCENPVGDAAELAQLGATAVLKGASRVIAGLKNILISASGASGMARGGSGDVYTGILGALLAASPGQEPVRETMVFLNAEAACEIHGLAGELACKKYGRSMNAADIIEFLPEVFQTHVD